MKYIWTAVIFASAALAQTPSTEAIDALRGLNSVTDVGINVRDYSTRVLDAKVKVDKYLADAPKDAAKPVATIMEMYVIALKAWNANIAKDYPARQRAAEQAAANPDILACPGLIHEEVKVDPAEVEKLLAAAREALAASGHANTEPSPETMAALKKEQEQERADRERRKNIDLQKFGSDPTILWKCAAKALDGLKK